MEYRIAAIAQLCAAQFLSSFEPEQTVVSALSIDSRNVEDPANTLFFAIIGVRHNGHQFISKLYESGVRNFVISDPSFYHPNFIKANFLLVHDTLSALQIFAAKHRQKFQIPIIGITGSNGKTIVKEWLYLLLRHDYKIVKSPKSYNSQVGVPLSVFQMNEAHTLGIFEAGISLPGEMSRIAAVIQPQIGIITNIGAAHDENFINIDHKTDEKMRLFENAETLIYCKDVESISKSLKKSALLNRLKLFTWSKQSAADLLIVKIARNKQESIIQGIFKNNFIQIKIFFTDDASIENAISCWCVMLNMGYEHDEIEKRMCSLSPVAMRLELKQGINNCTIINDSYNSDISSLAIALDFLNQQNQHINKTLILSDILQSGKEEEKLYADVADMCLHKGVSKIIGVGSALFKNQHLFQIKKSFYKDTDDFLNHFSASAFKDETILIKGARPYKFEQISKLLQQKAHQTVLEINLNALVHNINQYKSLLHKKTKIMAMVKAFSYGSGSFEIANTLQYNNVDYLAVAYTDEGVELRKAGVKLPIMVMNPDRQNIDQIIQFDLEPEVYSFKILKELAEAFSHQGKAHFPVHLKLDTGMHRLGFEEADIEELCLQLKRYPFLQVKSVFSHLVASDELEHDDYTRQQIASYMTMCTIIQKYLGYTFLKHILNSAGALRFPEFQFDMVRLGIGIHGLVPVQSNLFIPTIQLKTIISQIKNLNAGQTVGYSRKGVLAKNSRIATVPIGYADGYVRKLGHGKGLMCINGKLAPTVGNICMDMTMLDITGIEAEEGDEVVVFGEGYPVTELAKVAETIPYEILTSMSGRIKRVYYQE